MNKTIIFLAILLVIGIAGYFILFTGNNSPSPAQTASQSPSPENTQPGSNTSEIITIKNFAFSPNTVSITAGTTVIWKNEDSVAHSIKSDTFNSQLINPGDSVEIKFSTAGTYNYTCGIHPQMQGQIIVN